MRSRVRIALVADRLQDLRDDHVSCSSLRGEIDELFAGLDLDPVYENLQHYLDDEDIRARDPAYRAMQQVELDKMIRLLRSGAPLQELGRITFLGSS